MHLTALDTLQDEHQEILALADRMADTLERRVTKSRLEYLVHDVLDQHERVVRVHLAREKQCFLDVLREHVGDAHPDILEGAMEQILALEASMHILRSGVESGAPLRLLLEEAEISLREYVEYEETHVHPWGVRMLGPVLLQEVERRHRDLPPGQVIGFQPAARPAEHRPMI